MNDVNENPTLKPGVVALILAIMLLCFCVMASVSLAVVIKLYNLEGGLIYEAFRLCGALVLPLVSLIWGILTWSMYREYVDQLNAVKKNETAGN